MLMELLCISRLKLSGGVNVDVLFDCDDVALQSRFDLV
jgi:hypothetical protein